MKTRLGRCYELAAKYVMDNPNTVLVHGTIEGFGYPPNPHAWVDTGSGVLDAVVDGGFTYQAWEGFASPVEHSRFTHSEVRSLVIEHEHWGPW